MKFTLASLGLLPLLMGTLLPAAQASSNGIQILSANYAGYDVTATAQYLCDTQETAYSANCNLVATDTLNFDPAYGQQKRFDVTYRCALDGQTRSATLNPVGTGAPTYLYCQNNQNPQSGIRVLSAQYANIDVTYAAQAQCDSYANGYGCTVIPTRTLSYDPSYGNSKDFVIQFVCNSDGRVQTSRMYPVGTDAALQLNCNGYNPVPQPPLPPRPLPPLPPRPLPPRPTPPLPPRPIPPRPIPPRPIPPRPIPPRPVPQPPRPIPQPPRPIPQPPRPIPAPLPRPIPGGQCPPGTHMDPQLGRCVR